MTNPTDQLVAEHVNIVKCLDVLTRLGQQAEGPNPPLDAMQAAVTFVREYADRLHHGKEEDLLFPAMEANGMPREMGPIACMLKEHELGRAAVGRLEDGIDALRAGKADGGAEFAEAAATYVALLREHIIKENEILFAMAEDILPAETKATLLTQFASVEQDEIGEEAVAAQLTALEQLAGEFLGTQAV